MTDAQVDVILELFRQHAEEDTRRLGALDMKLDKVVSIAESLAESRALARGAWKATTLVAGLVSGVISALGVLLPWLVRLR